MMMLIVVVTDLTLDVQIVHVAKKVFFAYSRPTVRAHVVWLKV